MSAVVRLLLAGNLATQSPEGSMTPGATVAEPAARIVLVPIRLHGDIEPGMAERLDRALRDGLERDRRITTERHEPLSSPCRRACIRRIAAAGGADHVLSAHVHATDRRYRLHLELVDVRTGEIAQARESVCEICAIDEVASLLADEAASLSALLVPRPTIAPPPATPSPLPPAHDPAQDRVLAPPSPIATMVLEPTDAEPRAPDRRRSFRIAGGAILGTGIAIALAGVPLVALHNRPYEARCSGDDIDIEGRCRFSYDTLAGGLALLVSGAVIGAVGMGLLLGARRNHRMRDSAAGMAIRF